jgi:hypothetical protein
VGVLAMSTMLASNQPDVLVEVGGGTIPATTTAPTPTTQTVTGAPTKATTAPTILSAPSPTTTSTTRPGMTALTAASTLDLGGLGPVRVGMTPAEATVAAGIPVVASGTADCSYATATGGPAGVAFKLAPDGRIARVEVRPGSPVKTLSGAGVGDTEAEVQARYGNVLEVLPHKYLAAGHYLTLVPTDAADIDSRLIFETDGSKVTTFRSGTLPQVALVEGCG